MTSKKARVLLSLSSEDPGFRQDPCLSRACVGVKKASDDEKNSMIIANLSCTLP